MYCTVCGAANEAGNSVCTVCTQPIGEDSGKTWDEPLLNGRYRILTQVGTGGFGAVYKARDTLAAGQGTDSIAIKQVNLRGLNPQEIIEATDGFHREVLLLSNLEHVNLPQIYDSFTDPEHWYLEMDFIEGETLEQYMQKTSTGSSPATTRSLPLDEVFSIALQLCHVLHYLHTRQPPIIFRDLKPANVMRAPEGNLYLIDFGIARQFKPGQAKDTMPFGSPGYAAPEQYGKAQTTPRSDIYSLGALLHQLLSGEDPAETPFRFAPLRLYGTVGLAELEALIMRMVDMDPGKRPASTAEVKEEMRRIVMFRMLRTNEGTRIWRPGQPQDMPAEFPPPPWQTIAPGSGQQQQVQASQAGPSRRKVLVGGLLAGAALVAGIEGFAWLLQRSDHSRPPAPVLKPVLTQHQLAQVVYRGHAGRVWSVAWSPDGQFIASTSKDNTVQVWQAANGKRVSVYDTSSVHAAAWSPNGERIAVGSFSCVEILNVATGEVVFKHDKPYAEVTAVTWSPDGRYIAWGSSGYDLGLQFRSGTVEVWEVATNRRAYIYYAPGKDTPVAIAWSPDGKYLAFGGAGGVRIWETAAWSPVYTETWSGQRVEAVAWSPDSKHFATAGSLDPTVYVIDVTNPWHPYTFSGHIIGVESLTWSPDGKRIASGGIDHTVQVWEP